MIADIVASRPTSDEKGKDARLTALNRLVLKACQSDRNARFADAMAMLQTLQQDVVDRTPSDRPEGMKVAPGRIRRLLGRAIVAVCLAAALTAGWLVWRGLNSVPKVDVNFITDQWDAEIWLDGRRLCQPDGEPWLTPCTVTGVSAKTHAVVLKRQGLEDLELGRIDFGSTREVVAHWGIDRRDAGGQPQKDGG